MRLTTILSLLAGLMLLVGCEPVVSVHPLYSPEATVFEPGLLGCWTEESGEDCLLRFAERDGGSYSVVLKEDDGSESLLVGRALRLGDALFLDIRPEGTSDQRTVQAFHFAAMHTFYRIEFEEGVLRIAYLDDEWLSEALGAGSVTLAHRQRETGTEHEIILTEPTTGLQKFVQEYAQDEDAFPSLGSFHRMETNASPRE